MEIEKMESIIESILFATGRVVTIEELELALEVKKEGKVSLVGFGTFTAKKREARNGRNPQTGETVKIAARVVPGFKAGNKLKDAFTFEEKIFYFSRYIAVTFPKIMLLATMLILIVGYLGFIA